MHTRVMRNAAGLAAVLLLATAGLAFADTLRADGDLLTADVQGEVDLGSVAPGATLQVDVAFALTCSGFRHVDANQTITVAPGPAIIPAGGDLSFGGAVLAPPGSGWPVDWDDCPASLDPIVSSELAHVTLVAPPNVGDDFEYLLTWTPSVAPVPAGDMYPFTGSTSVTFRLDVVFNTPPELTVPADMIVEGNTLGGWTGDWVVTATDAQDALAPTPVCVPAAGSLLAIGTTTVACSVEDSGGLTDEGSFDVTVIDTTAPAIDGMPGDQVATTADPDGRVVTWTAPTASDVVDGATPVDCAPASGNVFAVGATAVTCTSADASGNAAIAGFTVTVVRGSTASVTWGEPVGNASVVVAQVDRTVPLKANIALDGTPIGPDGPAPILLVDRLDGCGGSPVTRTEVGVLEWSGGAWRTHLDAGSLGSGCWRVSLSIGDVEAGAFELALRPIEGVVVKKSEVARSPAPQDGDAAIGSPTASSKPKPKKEPHGASGKGRGSDD